MNWVGFGCRVGRTPSLTLRIRPDLPPEAVRHFQPVPLDQFGVREEVARGAVGGEFAGVQHQYPRAHVEDEVEVVRGDQLRAREGRDERDQVAAAARVEERGWFIE